MPLTLWLWICLLLGRIFPWETRRVQVELLGSVYLLCWLWGFQARSPSPSRLFCVLFASFPFWPKISSTSSTLKCSVLQGESWPAFICIVQAAVALFKSCSLLLLHYLILDTKSRYKIFSSVTNAKKYDGILYHTDAFLGFLPISGSDSKLAFSLNPLEACLNPWHCWL